MIQQLSLVKGNRFASLVYRSPASSELCRYTVLIGYSYNTALETSLATVRAMSFAVGSLESQAQAEVIASFEKSLAAAAVGEVSADYTKAGLYENVTLDGKDIKGLRFNPGNSTFKVLGMVTAKVVLKQGTHKTVKSSPLTLAKNAIKKGLPVSKLREFTLDAATLETAKLNGEVLEMA